MGQQPRSFIPDNPVPKSFVPASEEEQKTHDIRVKEEQAQDPAYKQFGRSIIDALSGVSEGLLGLDPNAERGDIGDYINLGLQGAGVLGGAYGLYRGGKAAIGGLRRVPKAAPIIESAATELPKSIELPQRRYGELDYTDIPRPAQNYGHFRRMGEKDYQVPNNPLAIELDKERTRIFVDEVLRQQRFNPAAVKIKPKVTNNPNAANPAPSLNQEFNPTTPILYHGSQKPIEFFDPNHIGEGAFPNMIHFSEDPTYASLYSTGWHAGGPKTQGVQIPSTGDITSKTLKGAQPNVIPGRASTKRILDLTKPIDKEAETLIKVLPKEQGDKLLEAINNTDFDKEVWTLDDVLNAIDDPEILSKLPYDAYKYRAHGIINWAFPHGTDIRTPSGTPLTKFKNSVMESSVEPELPSLLASQETPIPDSTLTAKGTLPPTRPPTIPPTGEASNQGMNTPLPNRPGFIDTAKSMGVTDWMNVPRAAVTTLDLSAPLRQGFGLIHKKEWWKAWDDMVRSAGSEGAFQTIMQDIAARPNFNPRPKLDSTGQAIIDTRTGLPKLDKSFAETVGLKLTEIGNFSKTEEQFLGAQLLEAIPGYGRLVRGSNRAYVGFLNKLRADTFDSLISNAQKMGRNPETDQVLAKQLADFVNNATGRGSLGGLEKSAEVLQATFFSPRLISSRLQMMNPKNYMGKDPLVRKEYWKSFFGMAAAGNTLLGLGKLAGADVNLDPRSSDFAKVKIGNTRLDPWGGFQQYGVLAARLMSGQTANTQGDVRDLGSTPFSPTRAGLLASFKDTQQYGRGFVGNKVQPVIGFVWDWLSATPNKPFDVSEGMKDLLVPIIAQDIQQVLQEDPSLLWTTVPAGLGMGAQTYGPKQ